MLSCLVIAWCTSLLMGRRKAVLHDGGLFWVAPFIFHLYFLIERTYLALWSALARVELVLCLLVVLLRVCSPSWFVCSSLGVIGRLCFVTVAFPGHHLYHFGMGRRKYWLGSGMGGRGWGLISNFLYSTDTLRLFSKRMCCYILYHWFMHASSTKSCMLRKSDFKSL